MLVLKKKEFVKLFPSKKICVVVKLMISVFGAAVMMSGVKLGSILLSRKLKFGRYSITVVKDGYVAIKQKVVVVFGDEQKLHFELVLVKKAVVVAIVKSVTVLDSGLSKFGAKLEEGLFFYKQWWFWMVVGVAVVGIVTTFVVLSIDDELVFMGTVNFGISFFDYDFLV